MSIPDPFRQKLLGGTPHAAPAQPEEPAACAPNAQDRLFCKYDAARMIHQLRQRSGLSEAQFAARLGMKFKDVLAAEIGEADYQHTMDVRDRVQTMFGSGVGDPQVQPQAERRSASIIAAWIEQLPD